MTSLLFRDSRSKASHVRLVFVADYWRRGAVLTARHRCRNDPGAFRELIMFRICVILRFANHSWGFDYF